MAQLFADGARAILAADIAAGDTTLTIASGGAKFPVANTDTGAVGGALDWYKAVLDDDTNFEIVYIRTHTSGSNSFTNVLRAQEGTTARAFTAGKVMGVRVTAEDMRLSVGREMLTAARTYYVRTAPAAVSFTAASANVTWAAHGLSVNAAVVLSILPNTGTVTVTLASPGVFTKTGHGYAAGRPVKFSTTGALPTGLTAGTTYYVIAAGLTADAFQVSATVGGAAINTSGSQSGIHYAEAAGAMPTFSTAGLLVAGTVYYVKTVVDANNVTLSTTAGGTALGTCTVATGSPIYSASTGSDSNTGLVNAPNGAFLTAQKAVDVIGGTLDLGVYGVIVQMADSTHTAPVTVPATWTGLGNVTIQGTSSTTSNVLFSVTGNDVIVAEKGARLIVKDMKLTATGNYLLRASTKAHIDFSGVNFGTCGAQQIRVDDGGSITCTGPYSISGGGSAHWGNVAGVLRVQSKAITLTGTPAFSSAFLDAAYVGVALINGNTFSGSATGARYTIAGNAVANTSGAGATYLPGNAAHATPTPSGGQYI